MQGVVRVLVELPAYESGPVIRVCIVTLVDIDPLDVNDIAILFLDAILRASSIQVHRLDELHLGFPGLPNLLRIKTCA